MTPQEKQIINYVLQKGSITNRDAVIDLGIDRLSARIKDMRDRVDERFEWVTIMEEKPTRNGTVARYGRYYPKNIHAMQQGFYEMVGNG